MLRRTLLAGVSLLVSPGLALAQGRSTKVYYDDGIAAGSQPLQRAASAYFEILTTPAPEDPAGGLLCTWGPRLDRLFENVTENLCLSRSEVYRYLLFPRFFGELEKLCFEGRLRREDADAVLARVVAAGDSGAALPAEALAFAALPAAARGRGLGARVPQGRSYGDRITVLGDTIWVRLPEPRRRDLQRCVLYRTVTDFIATPIGPTLPEGVLGFVPRHDPARPVVVYASLGEHRLRRTAQHEIAHAVIEGIAVYLRSLDVSRMLNGPRDSVATRPWRPASGGFAAITHENYAEYLAFPPGQMDPALRASLVEMVAENSLDGLAAMSVGARTLASSYIEGPARLAFLADLCGRDLPKRLLLDYHGGGGGFLDALQRLTGKSTTELEQLYRRWLRERYWGDHLATDVPETLGTVAGTGWAGVRRDGTLLLSRARRGRHEVVVLERPTRPHGKPRTHVVARDLDGNDRLPLFSTPDLRRGRAVTAVRHRNVESLLLVDVATGRRRERALRELGEVREVHDPRFSPTGRAVTCRVVDRAGRNALAHLDLATDRARLLVPWQWAEVASPSFAGGDSLVLFSTTDTPDRTADLRVVEVATGVVREVTRTPGESEQEPLLVRGHLVYLSDRSGVPQIYAIEDGGPRLLVALPFPAERLQAGDSTLALVANSLRHGNAPAQRAVWEFPLGRIGLDAEVRPALPAAPVWEPVVATAGTPGARDGEPAGAPDAERPQLALAPGFLGPVQTVTPYRQRWRLMPLGLNVSALSQDARGVSFFGFDTEFHDQSVVASVGQSGRFDRYAMLQYRNRTARTHWQAGGYHRSIVRRRYAADSLDTFDRRETEQGLLLSAQYHKSLVTRIGAGLAIARRSEADGAVVVRTEEATREPVAAPVLGLELGGIRPAAWAASLCGVPRLEGLLDRSPAAMGTWTQALAEKTSREEEFVASLDYVRPNVSAGLTLSRDTRVWFDYRGPDSGSLLVLQVSGGVDAPGRRTYQSAAGTDSLREHVGSGLDRVAGSWLFLTHRRAAFVDFAFRCRGLLNDGPQAILYGLGGIYSVSGYPRAGVRSHGVAWSNAEARVQLWDYSRWRLPVPGMVFPAADGFLYLDAGLAQGAEALHSYGLGLRLRLGFLAFEWRHPLRAGQPDQRGLAFLW